MSHSYILTHTVFYSQLKFKVVNILAKATALCTNLNIYGAPISSCLHAQTVTPPTHKQASYLSPFGRLIPD